MVRQPSLADMAATLADRDVAPRHRTEPFLSAAMAALISLVFGTPFAYLLARRRFSGENACWRASSTCPS